MIEEATERVSERGHTLPGLGATELDVAVVDPAVRRPDGRGRAYVDRPRHPPARRVPAQRGILVVDPQREGMRPVHIGIDDRDPVILEIVRELALHRRIIDRDAGRQDEEAAIVALPQDLDHLRHQAQYPSGALKLVDR